MNIYRIKVCMAIYGFPSLLASFLGSPRKLVSSPDTKFFARALRPFFDKAAGRAQKIWSGDETTRKQAKEGLGTRLKVHLRALVNVSIYTCAEVADPESSTSPPHQRDEAEDFRCVLGLPLGLCRGQE